MRRPYRAKHVDPDKLRLQLAGWALQPQFVAQRAEHERQQAEQKAAVVAELERREEQCRRELDKAAAERRFFESLRPKGG